MSHSGFSSGVATRRALDIRVPPRSRQGSSEPARHRELEINFAALKKDYAELHASLAEAGQVYRRLCAPRLVQHGNFEIASEIFAVRHVPGDFFTVQETSNGVVLALGDICGKGLAAGMWTPHLVGLVGTHTAANPEPAAIVSRLNEDLCRMSSTAPLTSLLVGRLDPASGALDYCNAGHPPGLLLRANGQMELLSEGGLLLGVLPEASFDQGRVQLRAGDVLLVCSDGILESVNEADQEFGIERLETQLRNAQKGSADSVLFSILGAVQDFAAPRPLTDDMTLAIVNHRDTTNGRKIS